jgi:hypothetical protein
MTEQPLGYEPRDTSPKGVLLFYVGLFAMIALALLIAGLIYSPVRESSHPSPAIQADQIPPPPRLEVTPAQELWNVRAEEKSILNTYGWEDRNAGVVRIPISRAIDLLAERGLPYRSGSAPVPTSPATGPESGGPQTGVPQPRGVPAQKGVK